VNQQGMLVPPVQGFAELSPWLNTCSLVDFLGEVRSMHISFLEQFVLSVDLSSQP
jgi:hypothetical protein